MDHPLSSRLQLFPITTRIEQSGEHTELMIGGCRLSDLGREFGTPLYLYDRQTLDTAVSDYKKALAEYYPGSSGITYAGKAFLCLAIAQWAAQNDLWLDCTGAGELAISAAARIPSELILVHGVNKNPEDRYAAITRGGTIVVDNLSELQQLAQTAREGSIPLPDLWLRLRPGVAVDTHSHRQTGQTDSKFGMSQEEIQRAVSYSLVNDLPISGVHFHQGSHFHDPSPLRPAIETTLELLANLRSTTGWYPRAICTGGGWGIPYHEDDLPHPTVEDYLQVISSTIIEACHRLNLPLPHLQIEPGRSLVARGGVALYQVGAIKQTAHRHWLLLDGGMADNPRPALYGARYSALPVQDPQRKITESAWLAGPYCESGDILIENLALPEIQPGEWIAVPASGAYHLSMASNYNGARKPAVIWLDDGEVKLIQRRETLEDLYRRDLPID